MKRHRDETSGKRRRANKNERDVKTTEMWNGL